MLELSLQSIFWVGLGAQVVVVLFVEYVVKHTRHELGLGTRMVIMDISPGDAEKVQWNGGIIPTIL